MPGFVSQVIKKLKSGSGAQVEAGAVACRETRAVFWAVAREGTRAPLVMLTGGAGHRVDSCFQRAKAAGAFVSRHGLLSRRSV